MKTNTIRQKFIEFFEKKGHTAVAAAPVVQKNNPSLLFVNAGMNPFTDIFLGNQHAMHPRVVNSQPCLRVTGKHNDLEEVGVDTYHHTLFEMLGNWSFGDFFKKEAIAYAFELITEVYKIPLDRLYMTVFEGSSSDGLDPDTESYELWKKYMPKEQILYMDKKDNFWEMGASGPCGPCTEIHVDVRPEALRKEVAGHTLVNKDHPQVIEIWNLVFIAYHRQANGDLVKLSKQYVDTGMGLERLAMVLQGKEATYDTDAFQPLIKATEEASGATYGKDPQKDIALRVVADHIRAITFAIADGAIPSNQQAGYVIRRLLRRAVRYSYQHLHLQEPFLHTLVPSVIAMQGDAFPSLKSQQAFITKVIHEEERNFLRTLAQGIRHFQQVRADSVGKNISGEAAFQLYDTYGFPLDLTQLMAQENGLKVDTKGFDAAMQVQKNRSKKAAEKSYEDWQVVRGEDKKTTFVGYDMMETESLLLAYRAVTKQGKRMYELVLDTTPFYPEGGGQVGDSGFLYSGEETIAVLDTRKALDTIIHYTESLPSNPFAPIKTVIDKKKRLLAANNHTATHLLEGALRQTFGTHITQRGSYLDNERLRFDFSHPEKISAETCYEIETLVNEKIRANIPRQEERSISFEEAKAKGAIFLANEQYGERVRMVTFDPSFSVALCGGTHVSHTGALGMFKIIAETSVGSGIRRIEAVTATAAEVWVQGVQTQLLTLQQMLKNPQDPIHALELLQKSYKAEHKKVAAYQTQALEASLSMLEKQLTKVADKYIGVFSIDVQSVEVLRKTMNMLGRKYTPLILVCTAAIEERAYVAVSVAKELQKEYHAQDIVTQLSPHIGGKGGGKAAFALAQGQDIGGLTKVLDEAKKIVIG